MVLSTVSERRLVDANDAFFKVLGYSRGEILGKIAVEFGLYDPPEQMAAISERLRTDGRISDFHVRVRCKNGRSSTACCRES
jgi:PAS domain S-box-containing protein